MNKEKIIEEYEERAAILEYDAHMTRESAETLALKIVCKAHKIKEEDIKGLLNDNTI